MMTRAAVFTEILDKLFQEKKLSFVMPVSSTSRSSTMMIPLSSSVFLISIFFLFMLVSSLIKLSSHTHDILLSCFLSGYLTGQLAGTHYQDPV